MNTAVDTSVLIAVAKGESDAEAWVQLLAAQSARGSLVICEIVAAEFFALLLDEEMFKAAIQMLGIQFSPANLLASQMAGRLFRRYRDEGGPREYLIPDFLVGAHALAQAGQLAAIDRGYLRRYFSKLKVLAPST
jgi:predicted nucleic acid-binding protein